MNYIQHRKRDIEDDPIYKKADGKDLAAWRDHCRQFVDIGTLVRSYQALKAEGKLRKRWD